MNVASDWEDEEVCEWGTEVVDEAAERGEVREVERDVRLKQPVVCTR